MDFIDRQGLIRYLREQFQINWFGHHGIAHWARVRANGLMLARETGANGLMLARETGANDHVVELFAWFHDARRVSEHEDDGHGSRGAALAQQLNGHFFEATDAEMALLLHACRHHSEGLMIDDVTVMTCWDADRLDLSRVGMVPEPRYLCTKAARRNSSLDKANNRALSWKQRFDATRQEQLSEALRN